MWPTRSTSPTSLASSLCATSLSDSWPNVRVCYVYERERENLACIRSHFCALCVMHAVVNSLFMANVSYHWRIFLGGWLSFVGCLLVAFSPHMNFGIALVGICLIGAFSAFNESVYLGYFGLYPPSYVGGWSSGTGFAGVFGSAYYLLLSAAGLADMWIFLTQIPFVVLYWIAHFFVFSKPTAAHVIDAVQSEEAEAKRLRLEQEQRTVQDVDEEVSVNSGRS